MLDVKKYPLISDQIEYPELGVIIRNLEKVLTDNIPGDVVEMGCYTGTTSLFIQRCLTMNGMQRHFHVYDSFEGLPPKMPQDSSPAGEQFKGGELTASKQEFIKYFKQAGLKLPTIHKAWFEELQPKDLPPTIAFAFLDGDFYSSIQSCLHIITPRLSSGAIIVIDDYQSEALPGAAKAVDQWAKEYNLSLRTEQSLALITWK